MIITLVFPTIYIHKKPAMERAFILFCWCVLLGGDNADKGTILTAFVELHHTVDEGVERMVLAHTDILAGIVGRTALADDDVAGDALLTAENLNA